MTSDLQRAAAAETLRKTATRHGLARGETLDTYRAVQRVWRDEALLVWPSWRTGLGAFTQGVLDDIGLRPSKFHWVVRLTELSPDERWRHVTGEGCFNTGGAPCTPEGHYAPGNIEWRLIEPKQRRTPRGQCPGCDVCDHICFCPFDIQWDCPCPQGASARSDEPIERPHRIAQSKPTTFAKGWGHPDPERQKAKRRARRSRDGEP